MTLSCNCDMPMEIYADWCQDQGWDADELRDNEDVTVSDYGWYGVGNGCEDGQGRGGCRWHGDGVYYTCGNGQFFGYGYSDAGGCCFVNGDAR